jgi:hypothetical protein
MIADLLLGSRISMPHTGSFGLAVWEVHFNFRTEEVVFISLSMTSNVITWAQSDQYCEY